MIALHASHLNQFCEGKTFDSFHIVRSRRAYEFIKFVSGIIMSFATSLVISEPLQMMIDHPFLYYIVKASKDRENSSTKYITLFNGRVIEPKL